MQYEKRKQKNGAGTARQGTPQKELQRKISKIVVIVLPIIAVIALIIAIIVTSGSSKDTTSSGDAATESSSTDNSTDDSTSYSTDSSLTVEDGDTVNIDYVGSIDGVEFDGGNTQGNGTDLTIGSGRYIDDFEEQLIGAHPGDEVEVTVTFPDDYGNEELNGKEAVFDVTVNGIYQ